MRIVCVNRYFWPDHAATSQMLTDLANYLASQGLSVVVITSRQRYDDAGSCLPPTEQERGVRIVRVWSTRFGRTTILGRSLDYVSFYISAFGALLRYAKHGDVVLSKTDPPMIGVLAALLARARSIKRVNWLQDIFPEIAQAARLSVVKGFWGLVLCRIRDWSLFGATNVVLGARMKSLLDARGICSSVIIPNWSDGTAIRPLPSADNPLRRDWGLDDRFIVGYSGNLGRVHDITAITDAAVLLRHDASVVFLFIGGGRESDALREAAVRNCLSNVVFRPYQARETLALSLTLPDVHLVTLRPEYEGLVVPSKVYGVTAAGRACIFIGDDDGEVAQILKEGHCGITVPTGDGVALAAQIIALRDNPSRCRDMGDAARRIFEARFDMPVALAQWKCLLVGLLKNSA